MTDYFFISSPLHLFISAGLASQHAQHERIALFVSRDRAMAARFRVAVEAVPGIFSRCLELVGPAGKGRRLTRIDRQRLRGEFSRPAPMRLFTGNDRRQEFQYAMHLASRSGAQVEGIYMDEGVVTYVGHKSMDRLLHRYVDPLLRKLFYGRWYKAAITTGTSAWVSTAHVAFPDLVHPRLTSKRVMAIDPAPFKSIPLKALASALLADHPDYPQLLRNLRLILTLPHEGHYLGRPQIYDDISRQLLMRFPDPQLAIKPHPRITNPLLLERIFPGAILLDPSVGMEALLPLLPDNCIVAGDISSTLLTTRWLRPDLTVVAITVADELTFALQKLYHRLQVPMVRPEALEAALAGGAKPVE